MRILIASDEAREAAAAAALVQACALPQVEVLQPGPEGARPDEPVDVVLVADCVPGPKLWKALGLSGTTDTPVLLLCKELTESLARWASESGARVCLVGHGVGPLKSALVAAGQRVAKDRERERTRALVNVSVSDVLFSLRVEGKSFRFTEINPAFTKATGLTPEQVVGKLVDDIIPEPSRSLVLWKYREAISQGHTMRWDEVTDYPTGKKHGQVSITPILDAEGRCTSLLGTVHDVTEERQRAEVIQRYADITAAVQIGLTVWKITDGHAHPVLEATNPAAERIAGVKLSSMIGKPLAEILPAAMETLLPRLMREVARTQKERQLDEVPFPGAPDRIFSAKAFPLSAHTVGLAFEDVSEQARTRAVKAIEQKVLEMVAAGATLADCLTCLVLEVEALAPPATASVLLVSTDGLRVRHGAAPHLPDAYNRAIDGAPIGPMEGSCGSAAALKRSVIVTDIPSDPHWVKYRDLAATHGLRACWSTPILAADGRVLGTFALYYKEPRAPSPTELALIERATHVAGIAIGRHQIDEELRGLSARLEAAREEERTGIARELHDQLGQSLTALKLDLAWISRRAKEGPVPPAPLEEKLQELMALTDKLVDQTRRISSELRPALLDDVGLAAALAWQAKEFERRTQISCNVVCATGDVSKDLSTAVFRVFQEALTNVARHAGATRVEVRLEENANGVALSVRDDGAGIAAEKAQAPTSLGLVGIRERARRLGGTASIEPAAPRGTQVSLWLPRASPP